jgi:integrase
MAQRFDDAFVKQAIRQLRQSSKKEMMFTDKIEQGKSLLLRLSQHSATWKTLYYVSEGIEGGKQRRQAKATILGIYPQLTPREAYAKARAFEHQRAAVAAVSADTFGDVSQQWFTEKVKKKGLRSAREVKRHLDTYVLPSWRDLNIHEIKLTRINALLDAIAEKKVEHPGRNGKKVGGRSQADAVLATIRSVLVWYASRNEDYRCPITYRLDLKRDHRAAEEKQRDRVLDDDEIRSLWTACDQLGSEGVLVKLLLLTGQRLRKLVNMKWSDLNDGTWTIRSEKREKGNAGVLILPPLARDLIATLPRMRGSGYVFPAARGDGPINALSQLKRNLDSLLPTPIADFRFHDLRRTARTRLAELDIDDRLAEMVLGHKIKGVEAVYNRAKLTEKKADALNVLAAHIAQVIDPTPTPNNVVPLRERVLAERRL